MSIGTGGNLGSARGQIIIETAQARRNVKQLQGDMQTFGKATAQSMISPQRAGLALMGVGGALLGIFGLNVKAAANFEKQMDAVSASLGGVGGDAGLTTEQLQALNDEAIRIGKSTAASATEAAAAMELMAKAGVSVTDILNGGAQAAVDIGQATGESLDQSAATMSAMITLFQQTGITADQAADIIVNGMNSSQASMSEFQTGIARLAPMIVGTGMAFDEAAGLIAHFNALGISAAEVGGSLTSAYQTVISGSGPTIDALNALGISVNDAQGEFLGWPAIADQLVDAQDRIGNSAEFNNLIVQAFGRDGADILGIMANEGGDALRKTITDMDATGTAAKASQERMDNLSGSVEKLSGNVEALRIRMGKFSQGPLKAVVDQLASFVDVLDTLPDSVLQTVTVVTALGGGLLAAGGAAAFFGPQIREAAQALVFMQRAILGANPILLALAGLIALLTIAYKTNFGGFADWVDGTISRLRGWFASFSDTLKTSIALFGSLGGIFAAIGSSWDKEGGRISKLFLQIGRVAQRFVTSLNRMKRTFGQISRAFDRGIGDGFRSLFGREGQKLLAEFGDLLAAPVRTLGKLIAGIRTGFAPLDNIFKGLGRSVNLFGKAIEDLLAGNFGAVATDVSGIFTNLVDSIPSVLKIGKITLSATFDFVSNLAGTIWDLINKKLFGEQLVMGPGGDFAGATVVPAAFDSWKDLGTFVLSATFEFVSNITGSVWDWIKSQVLGTGIGVKSGIGGPRMVGTTQGDAIDVGLVLISGAVDLAGDLWQVANNFSDWFVQTFFTDRTVELGVLQADGSVEVTVKNQGTLAGGIGQTIADAITSAAGWTTAIAGAIVDKLTDIDLGAALAGRSFGSGEDIGAAIRSFIGKAIDAITLENIFDAGAFLLKVAKALAAGLAASAFGVATATTVLLAGLITFVAGVVKGLVFGEGDIDWTGMTLSLISTFTTAVSELPSKLSEILSNVFSGGGLTTKSKLGGMGLADNAGLDLGSMLTNLIGSVEPKLPDWLKNFGWLTNPIGELANAINAAIGPLKKAWDTFKSIKELFTGDEGKPVTSDVSAGAGANDPNSLDPNREAKDKGAEPVKEPFFGPEILTNLDTGKGKIADVGTELATLSTNVTEANKPFSDYATGVSTSMTTAATAAQTGAAAIVAALRIPSLGPMGFAVGVSFGQGVAQGILATIAQVASAAAALVTNAINAARNAIGAHSPADEPAAEIGVPFGQGIAMGIASQAATVAAALNSIMPSSANALGFGAAGATGGGGTMIVNQYALSQEQLLDMLDGVQAGRSAHAFLGQMTAAGATRFGRARSGSTR